MKTQYFRKNTYFFLVLILLSACATPIAPTGGPADKRAPVIEFTVPETGTTNFKGNSFQIQFNEYINRNTVANAITVEPDLGIPYDISWKRRRMYIDFAEDFPDSTTVILKLDGSISDVNGNRINKTTTLAISTGDEIDSGLITGRIKMAEDGKSASQKKILLYRTPVDFTKKAAYETSTDTSGTFTFRYLGEGSYQPLLVDDRNRNKIWDRSSELAQPFHRQIISLEKAGTDTLQAIYTSVSDTLNPRVYGVGLLSSQRLRLRFSETIEIKNEVEIIVHDSTGLFYSEAFPLFISPEDPFVLFAHSLESLREDMEYRLSLKGITDAAGNPADTSGIIFTGSAQSDTTLQRIISANDEEHLLQHDPFIVTYAAPITESEITDSLVVIEGTIDFKDWPEIEVQRNKLIVSPQNQWVEDIEYEFLVWNPVTQRRRMFEPQIWDSTSFGDIEISVQDEDSAAVVYAELKTQEGDIFYSDSFTNGILIKDLPPISYTLTVYKDENDNGKWDNGNVIPYQSPEPYYVQRGIRVQEGFTSQIEITF